jgi:hypothetical protein
MWMMYALVAPFLTSVRGARRGGVHLACDRCLPISAARFKRNISGLRQPWCPYTFFQLNGVVTTKYIHVHGSIKGDR